MNIQWFLKRAWLAVFCLCLTACAVPNNNSLDSFARTLSLLTPGGSAAYNAGRMRASAPYTTQASKPARIKVCAKYRKNMGWSKGYYVDATVQDGAKLNNSTNSFRFNALSKYVVIFWGPGRATLIELDMPFLSAIAQSGKDQQKRQWSVSTSSICY